MSKYLESWQNALNQVAEWKPRPGMPGNTHQQMLKEVAPPAGVSGGGVKKDDHFEKVKKIKDQINKQKDKVAKFDLGDPKQKTPHALATADLKTMNLKLRDMQSAENEPETDDTGKPNKKKQIKEGDEEVLDEFTNFKSITFKPKGKYVSDGKYEIVYDYGRKALVTKKQLNVWLKQKFIEEELKEGGENDRVRELLQKQETKGLSNSEKKELRELIKTISAGMFEDERLSQILRIKRAIEIAKKMAGNYTGATKEIEKIAKGLSKEKDVETALMRANEEKESKQKPYVSSSGGQYNVLDGDGKTVYTTSNKQLAHAWFKKNYDKLKEEKERQNESFKVGDKVKFVDKGGAHFDKKGKVIRDHGDGSYSVEILFPSGRTLTPNNVKNKDIVKEDINEALNSQQKQLLKINNYITVKGRQYVIDKVSFKNGQYDLKVFDKNGDFHKFTDKDVDSVEHWKSSLKVASFNPNKEVKEEEVLDEGVKLAHLVGQSIAHLGMYVELAEDIKKEYFKTNSQVSMFIKAKADQVLKNVPKLIKELRRPGIWSEQVDKADNAVKFWEDKQLDEALRDMEDYREKSKVLQSIQNDPKQMKDPQMRTAVMKRKLKLSQELSDLRAKQARQKPMAAEVEPGTYVKEEKTPQEKSKILVQIDKIKQQAKRLAGPEHASKIKDLKQKLADLTKQLSEAPFAVSYTGTKTAKHKTKDGANIVKQKKGTIKVDSKDEDSAKKLVSKILDKRMNLRRYDIDRVRAEDFKTFREGLQPGFAVRYLDPKNGKRFAVAYKTKVDADKKAAQLKSVGVKDISITKHNLNFKEDSNVKYNVKENKKSFDELEHKSQPVEVREQFTTSQLNNLKKQWAQVKTVNPTGEKYKALVKWINDKEFDMVDQLAKAKINFVSYIAKKALMDKWGFKKDTINKMYGGLLSNQYEELTLDKVFKEVSPPGWEGSVRAMKKHPELGGEDGKDGKNIYALAWYLKNKGAKPHYKDKGGKPVKKDKYKNEETEHEYAQMISGVENEGRKETINE